MSAADPVHSPGDETEIPLDEIDADVDPSHDAQGEPDGETIGLDPPLPPKRKGGRKPVS